MAKKSKSKKKKKQLKKYHFVNSPDGAVATSSAQLSSQASKQEAPTDSKSEAGGEKEAKAEIAKVSPKQAKLAAKAVGADAELLEKTNLMKADAKVTLIIGSVIVAVMIILWFVFEHTGVGPRVYDLIRFS